VNRKELLIELVAETRENRKDHNIHARSAMPKFLGSKKMKKHINALIYAQSNTAERVAEKEWLLLLQVKLSVAKTIAETDRRCTL